MNMNTCFLFYINLDSLLSQNHIWAPNLSIHVNEKYKPSLSGIFRYASVIFTLIFHKIKEKKCFLKIVICSNVQKCSEWKRIWLISQNKGSFSYVRNILTNARFTKSIIHKCRIFKVIFVKTTRSELDFTIISL